MCHEVEIENSISTCWVIDDGLAHRRRSSGGAYKPPTGAWVKSLGTKRDRKRLTKISQVRTRKVNESEPPMKHRELPEYCQNYPLLRWVGKA